MPVSSIYKHHPASNDNALTVKSYLGDKLYMGLTFNTFHENPA